MASFHYRIKSGRKGCAARHAAYIVRQGYYSRREDLLWSGYGNMPAWAADHPILLFASSDKYERANGSAYREHEIALPNELALEQLHDLVDSLVRELVGNKPYMYAVHRPTSSLQGEINTHLHLMMVDRVPDGISRPPEQMFSRYNPQHPEKGGCRKDSGGRTPLQVKHDMTRTREKIADTQNAALERFGYEARVSSKSLREQGIDKAPGRHLGPACIKRMSEKERAEYGAAQANGDQEPA